MGRAGHVRVLVVDDHPVFRRGVIDALGDDGQIVVCAEAADVQGALQAAVVHKPDVAIVDLSLGGDSGLRLIPLLTAEVEGLRVLVMSGHDERIHADRALKAGAYGYVMKDKDIAELITAVHRVAQGRPYVSAETAERLLVGMGTMRRTHGQSPLDLLSDRERQVLTLMGQGQPTRNIATLLAVSVKTIESHYARIKAKLGLRNGRELMRTAVSWSEGDKV